MDTNDKSKNVSGFKGWTIVILFSAVILAWGLATFILVKDRPREWDFGALKDVPGQSIYSTDKAPPMPSDSARQITILPEGKTWNTNSEVSTNR
jgi:hypothetical protein